MDLINGLFETIGGLFIWLSVRQVLKDKAVRGVSLPHVTIFGLWGLWNLVYYPHLGQWMSFLGGINVVTANLVWLFLLWKFTQEDRIRACAEPESKH